MSSVDKVAAVVIGRNEGERLTRCLSSLGGRIPCVYVDSQSVDDSVARARAAGVEVIALSTPPKMSAARGRNTGLQHLAVHHPAAEFAMMIDGDCEVEVGWLDAALAAIGTDERIAAVYGRRRERFMNQSIYNALVDDEWNTAIGDITTFGGDVLLRIAASRSVNGYDAAMIAAEDSDFAWRMIDKGWRIVRIDAPMTIHDAAILRFGQWWTRIKRGGHGLAELADRHPESKDPDWPRWNRSIIIWGAAMPGLLVATMLLAVVAAAAGFGWLPFLVPLAVAGLWPLKIAQIALRKRPQVKSWTVAIAAGFFLMFGKFPELLGKLSYHSRKAQGRETQLIEYKGAA